MLALLVCAFPRSDAAAQEGGASVLRGRVIAAGEGETRGVRVFARAGTIADSAEVDAEGRFALALPDSAAADSVELLVDAVEPTSRAFHPARVRLAWGDAAAREHEIVLVPLRWTIRSGRYAGREVEVRLARALAAPCRECSGFYRRSSERADSGRTRLQGWPAERFPLRVAFDREWSGENFSARDSAAFWREAEELEETVGVDVFRPATYPEAVPREDGGPDDVILVWFDPELRGIAGLGSAISNGVDIEYGDLRLHRGAFTSQGSRAGLVSHELMHTLGFGHTCAWRSVLADVARCPHLRASTATPEDVAYVQLAARVRALQREGSRRWALEAALAAIAAPPERERGLAIK